MGLLARPQDQFEKMKFQEHPAAVFLVTSLCLKVKHTTGRSKKGLQDTQRAILSCDRSIKKYAHLLKIVFFPLNDTEGGYTRVFLFSKRVPLVHARF
mmetsp:Transcript_3881/g.5145  ORF Transcript_3881/g.5145 Transcript_3881/m.5145 type:complete len:97 (+) Transcript_3881:240-530(+)